MPRPAASACLILAIATWSGASFSQEYPARPIRQIVPTSPGTVTDSVARILAPAMSKQLGQPIVVENKPGADSIVGLEYVARQVPADGYTTAVISVGILATLPVLVKDLRFDPTRDLPPFIGVAEGQFAFGSSPKLQWKTFREMVAYAKANPGKLNYGTPSTGIGLLMIALLHNLGLDVVNIPYKGGGPYMQALASAEIQMGFVAETAAQGFGEKFRVLAVTGPRRMASFQDAPTFTELGLAQIQGQSYSLNASSGTPRQALDRLHAASSFALQQPEVRTQLAKLKLEVLNEGSEAAAKRLAEQARFFRDVAREVGIKPQ